MEKEITVQELINVLWRGRIFILVVTAVALLLGGYYGFSLFTPSYRATTLIDVSPYLYEPGQLLEKGQVLIQQEEFLNAREMGIPPEALGGVRLEAIPNTDLLKVNVAYSDPETALKASRVVGEKLLEWASYDQQQALERQRKVLQTATGNMDEELAALESKTPAAGNGYPQGIYPHEKLLSARAEVTAQLHTVTADIEQLSTNPDFKPVNFVYPGQPPAAGALVQRLMYPAAAMILGLLASGLLVFMRYLWWAGDEGHVNKA